MNDLPLDPANIRWRASELLDRKRFAAARELLGTALRQHPRDAGLLYESARAEHLQDRNDQARAQLQLLLIQSPADADSRYLLFWVLCELKEWVQAEEMILGLLRDHPQCPDFWAGYAHLMLRCLLFDKAAALLKEALHINAHHELALRVQVLCDISAGRSGGEAIRKLLVEHPDDTRTLQLVVVALARQGRAKEALRLARELLRSQPDDHELLDQVRELAYQNHWTLAPLRPLQRFGWAGSAAIWLGVVLFGRVVDMHWPTYTTIYFGSWIGVVVYSWVWPPLLKRWLNR